MSDRTTQNGDLGTPTLSFSSNTKKSAETYATRGHERAAQVRRARPTRRAPQEDCHRRSHAPRRRLLVRQQPRRSPSVPANRQHRSRECELAPTRSNCPPVLRLAASESEPRGRQPLRRWPSSSRETRFTWSRAGRLAAIIPSRIRPSPPPISNTVRFRSWTTSSRSPARLRPPLLSAIARRKVSSHHIILGGQTASSSIDARFSGLPSADRKCSIVAVPPSPSSL